MASTRVIRRGLLAHQVWPFLVAAGGAAGLGAWKWLAEDGTGAPWLLGAAALAAGMGVLLMREPRVILEGDRFRVCGDPRPDGVPTPVPVADSGGPLGVRNFRSSDASYESRAPEDLPWDAAIPRDLVTGAAVRNGRLVVTLRERKGRSVPLQGISAEDRDALLAWFGVAAAKR